MLECQVLHIWMKIWLNLRFSLHKISSIFSYGAYFWIVTNICFLLLFVCFNYLVEMLFYLGMNIVYQELSKDYFPCPHCVSSFEHLGSVNIGSLQNSKVLFLFWFFLQCFCYCTCSFYPMSMSTLSSYLAIWRHCLTPPGPTCTLDIVTHMWQSSTGQWVESWINQAWTDWICLSG